MLSTEALKKELRAGPHAWPGGYPRLFLTEDGDTLCFRCVNKNVREYLRVASHPENSFYSRLSAVFLHMEGAPEYCAECNGTTASAYGELEGSEEFADPIGEQEV